MQDNNQNISVVSSKSKFPLFFILAVILGILTILLPVLQIIFNTQTLGGIVKATNVELSFGIIFIFLLIGNRRKEDIKKSRSVKWLSIFLTILSVVACLIIVYGVVELIKHPPNFGWS